MDSRPPYRNVRALTRGLDILQILNQVGSARVAQLAKAAGVDRTTAYRMLATLQDYGLVRMNASSDEYVLTSMVRRLSEGFTERDRTTQIVSGHLGSLFQKVLWPTDFAAFEQGAMVIQETTHRFSPYSVHRAMIGQPRPLLTSALGRAALAGASAERRTDMLDLLRGTLPADAAAPLTSADLDHLLEDYQRRGYAWSVGTSQTRTAAIAVAVHTGTHLAAAINLVFFRTAMSVETAATRYLEHLSEAARDIEASLAADPA